MAKLLAIGSAMLASSLILLLIKFTVDSGMPWVWVLAPIWMPSLILIVPRIITVGLLALHKKLGD